MLKKIKENYELTSVEVEAENILIKDDGEIFFDVVSNVDVDVAIDDDDNDGEK